MNSKRDEINEIVDNLELENVLLLPEEYDVALIGLMCQFNTYFVAYDKSKCIEILTTKEIDIDEAEEFFEFNIIGSYLGKSTPAFLIQ